jgi:hypothetical protein
MSGKQSMTGVRFGGKVEQRAGVSAIQTMDDIDASGDVQQIIDASGGNLDAIAAQLAILIPKIKDYAPNATREVESLQKAEAAARSGQTAEMLAALRGAGKWVIRLARDVGAELVAKLIEKQIGL